MYNNRTHGAVQSGSTQIRNVSLRRWNTYSECVNWFTPTQIISSSWIRCFMPVKTTGSLPYQLLFKCLLESGKFQCDPVSGSYNPRLPCPDLRLSPGLPPSRAACCDPLMPTALCSRTGHLQAHCALCTPALEMCSHGNGCILMETRRVPPMAPHPGVYWITFSGLNPSSLHVNGFLPESSTVIVPPLTQESEGCVKHNIQDTEKGWQSRWWII